MIEDIAFDDVLINPCFSMVKSRSEVSLAEEFLGRKLDLPILSANMDTISSPAMMKAMSEAGGLGVLHRFMNLHDNYKQFEESGVKPAVSVGIGYNEGERARFLFDKGAEIFVLDVAHGAAIHVVEQYDRLRTMLGNNVKIVVGNFANAKSIEDFNFQSKSSRKMDAAKIGIGGGSMCTTRIVTGCGRSTLSSVLDCARLDIPLIADGGFRTSGDVAKALAAGASAVMLGGMLAGTDETPGDFYYESQGRLYKPEDFLAKDANGKLIRDEYSESFKKFKKYRGSASKESYEVQGKVSEHRTAEGEATLTPHKGPVKDVLQQIKAGLLSSLSYVGAHDLKSFRENAELIKISNSVKIESGAHGKR